MSGVVRVASFVGLVGAAVLLASLSSCARNQHLESINIQPGNGTFDATDPALYFDYRAYGTYIHPPKTVDITSQVTWVSDNPQTAHFTAPGVVSPNTDCGVAQIFATMHDSPNDIVSNQVSITVDGPASQGCPTSTATYALAVSVTPFTDGNVSGASGTINCGESGNTVCAASFSIGSLVTLTETPANGHAFQGWGGGTCSGTATICTVTMNANMTVTATFN